MSTAATVVHDAKLVNLGISDLTLSDTTAKTLAPEPSSENNILPINKLPANLLVRILRLATESDHTTLRHVSEVCAQWYTTVSQNPKLWSTIPLDKFSSPDVAKHFVARSDPSPVTFHYSTPKGLQKADVKKLWEYWVWRAVLYRVEDLQLVLPRVSPSGSSVIQDWFADSKVPMLQRLSLAYSRSAGGRKQQVHVLPNPVADAPSLSELRLINFRFPWSPGQYAGLKKLYLSVCGRPDARHPMDESVLQLFRDSPQLEDITLEYDHTLHQLSTQLRLDKPIPLDHAKTVNLYLTLSDMTHILSSIALPETCTTLELRPASGDAHLMSNCLSWNTDQLANLRNLKQCFMNLSDINYIRFSQNQNQNEDGDPAFRATFHAGYIWYKLEGVKAALNWIHLVEALHPTNQISCIVIFRLGRSESNDTQLETIFRSIFRNPHLQRLVLQECQTEHMNMYPIMNHMLSLQHEDFKMQLVVKDMLVDILALSSMAVAQRQHLSHIKLLKCKLYADDLDQGQKALKELQDMYPDAMELVSTSLEILTEEAMAHEFMDDYSGSEIDSDYGSVPGSDTENRSSE